MGTGTEVAKNAGRTILSDDNFATIIAAVEQGRKLYDNLTKYVRFILITLVTFRRMTFLGDDHGHRGGAAVRRIQIHSGSASSSTRRWASRSASTRSRRTSCPRFPRPKKQSIYNHQPRGDRDPRGRLHGRLAHRADHQGIHAYGSLAIGSSMALAAFAWFRIVCAYQCPGERGTTVEAGDLRQPPAQQDRAHGGRAGVLIAGAGCRPRGLGTAPLNSEQWAVALVAGLSLFVLWEVGKASPAARRGSAAAPPAASPDAPVTTAA
ncbi:MAG: hypothetical protein U0869_05120 [Chloroflexota bacterium]